jgi:hypothetical protein
MKTNILGRLYDVEILDNGNWVYHSSYGDRGQAFAIRDHLKSQSTGARVINKKTGQVDKK